MKIIVEISDETYRQYINSSIYKPENLEAHFRHKIKEVILEELRTEVSCGQQVIKISKSKG